MNLLNTLLIWGLVLCLGATTMNAQNVYIPNTNFKTYLVNNTAINTNGDSHIQVSEALAFTGGIYCINRSIDDLTGIEYFVNLRILYCNYNQLTNLNLTPNTKLTYLNCSSNQLSSLNISQSNSLTQLYCDKNQLSTLDVSQKTSLKRLSCSSNKLGNLNVTQNTNLTYLDCSSNKLSNLNVTQNTSLKQLNCDNNKLSNSLNISSNTGLTYLDCAHNQLNILDVGVNINLKSLFFDHNKLTNIDLTTNSSLTALDCSSNELRRLNLSNSPNLKFLYCSSNKLVNLNVKNGNGNYTKIIRFETTNNPNLNCIEVNNVSYSTTNWTNIDATSSFQINCPPIFPMANPYNTNAAIGDREVERTIALTNINTIKKEVNLSAYPNPVIKEITLDFGKTYKEATLQVTNLTGQLVLSKKLENSSKTTLELEGPTGIYFLSIQTEEGKATLKVVKE